MPESTAVPGPDEQDIDLHGALPDPAEFGESLDDPAGSHGEFHDRPDFNAGGEAIVYCPCEDPLGAPDPACPVHGRNADA